MFEMVSEFSYTFILFILSKLRLKRTSRDLAIKPPTRLGVISKRL